MGNKNCEAIFDGIKSPLLNEPEDHFHPRSPECIESAAEFSIGDQRRHFSESGVQRTDIEPQTSKRVDTDRPHANVASSRLGTEEFLQVEMWARGLRKRVHSLKKSPDGQVIVIVEVEPFEIAIPDWNFTLPFEANYAQIRDHVKAALQQARFTIADPGRSK
jgi:hypothetical protein